MKLISIAALGACALTGLAATRSHGQVPTQVPPGLPAGLTPDQLAQLMSQSPQAANLIRQRLQQSGLTPEQIRAQLAASGYAPNLLDAYFGAAQPGQAGRVPGVQELGAMQALGLFPSPAAESLQVDTGSIYARGEALRAESDAAVA